MPRAGLDAAVVTGAAAAVADEVGLAHLNMTLVAERLGVRGPSLYKHVDGLSDLTHHIATLATAELGDGLREATQGRAGHDALRAAARTVRTYVAQHPGRYGATTGVHTTGPDDPLTTALERTLGSFAAVLRGYQLEPAEEIHALRMLRSFLHGFATLEAGDGFQLATDIDESFAWIIDFIDRGLRGSSGS